MCTRKAHTTHTHTLCIFGGGGLHEFEAFNQHESGVRPRPDPVVVEGGADLGTSGSLTVPQITFVCVSFCSGHILQLSISKQQLWIMKFLLSRPLSGYINVKQPRLRVPHTVA